MESQLLDELPMLAGSSVFIYAIASKRFHAACGSWFALGLAVFTLVVCGVYVTTWDFAFFEKCYAIQVAVIVITSVYYCYSAQATAARRCVATITCVPTLRMPFATIMCDARAPQRLRTCEPIR